MRGEKRDRTLGPANPKRRAKKVHGPNRLVQISEISIERTKEERGRAPGAETPGVMHEAEEPTAGYKRKKENVGEKFVSYWTRVGWSLRVVDWRGGGTVRQKNATVVEGVPPTATNTFNGQVLPQSLAGSVRWGENIRNAMEKVGGSTMGSKKTIKEGGRHEMIRKGKTQHRKKAQKEKHGERPARTRQKERGGKGKASQRDYVATQKEERRRMKGRESRRGVR